MGKNTQMNNITSERVLEILKTIENEKQKTFEEYSKECDEKEYLMGYYKALEFCEQLIKGLKK